MFGAVTILNVSVVFFTDSRPKEFTFCQDFHRDLTHLGWSFKLPHFLPPFDPKEGQMQKKNCRYGAGNIKKQTPWFRSGSILVPPLPFQFLRKSNKFLPDQIQLLKVRRNWNGIRGTSLESEQNQGVCFSMFPVPQHRNLFFI